VSKRRRPDTEVEIDMTPMIDLTFLLIIFFIIVNDLTQQELEDLKLPIAQEAGHDDPPPGRPILNVLGCTCESNNPKVHVQNQADEDLNCRIGAIVWKKKDLYWRSIEPVGTDPIRKGRPDYYWKLAETMAVQFVPNMATAPDPVLGDLPDDPVLIRADRNTPFKYIQRIMEVCARQNIKIWKVQLAASEPVGQE
jgi:biopolymer transport protein ExbD